jgi:hypothetical protein
VYARLVRRTATVIGAIVLVAASCSRGPDNAELCQDLTNLEGTVAYLDSPPRTATVGDVRGSLDKLDGTWEAVHHDRQVPDDEDEALQQSQQDYRDAIDGIGDDDLFAPYASDTRGIGEGLMRAYQAVRVRLVCPAYLQPG